MIKKIIKVSLLSSVSLYLASFVALGISFSNSYRVVIFTGIALCLANILIKPLIKLVMLPINLITLGVFSWVANLLIFYAVSEMVSGFSISGFVSKEYIYKGFIIPSVNFGYLEALIFSSFLVGIIFNLIYWLMED